MDKPLEYETSDKIYYLEVAFKEDYNKWDIYQTFKYKNEAGWNSGELYIPSISLNKYGGKLMFTIMITIAILGIIFKLCWFNSPRWLQTSLYIGMGWAAVFMIKPLSTVLPSTSILLLVTETAYSK